MVETKGAIRPSSINNDDDSPRRRTKSPTRKSRRSGSPSKTRSGGCGTLVKTANASADITKATMVMKLDQNYQSDNVNAASRCSSTGIITKPKLDMSTLSHQHDADACPQITNEDLTKMKEAISQRRSKTKGSLTSTPTLVKESRSTTSRTSKDGTTKVAGAERSKLKQLKENNQSTTQFASIRHLLDGSEFLATKSVEKEKGDVFTPSPFSASSKQHRGTSASIVTKGRQNQSNTKLTKVQEIPTTPSPSILRDHLRKADRLCTEQQSFRDLARKSRAMQERDYLEDLLQENFDDITWGEGSSNAKKTNTSCGMASLGDSDDSTCFPHVLHDAFAGESSFSILLNPFENDDNVRPSLCKPLTYHNEDDTVTTEAMSTSYYSANSHDENVHNSPAHRLQQSSTLDRFNQVGNNEDGNENDDECWPIRRGTNLVHNTIPAAATTTLDSEFCAPPTGGVRLAGRRSSLAAGNSNYLAASDNGSGNEGHSQHNQQQPQQQQLQQSYPASPVKSRQRRSSLSMVATSNNSNGSGMDLSASSSSSMSLWTTDVPEGLATAAPRPRRGRRSSMASGTTMETGIETNHTPPAFSSSIGATPATSTTRPTTKTVGRRSSMNGAIPTRQPLRNLSDGGHDDDTADAFGFVVKTAIVGKRMEQAAVRNHPHRNSKKSNIV